MAPRPPCRIGWPATRRPPVRLLRNDENYGLGGSHKVAFGYAAAHGYQHLVVLHGDDQGAVADLLPILNDGTYKNYDCCLGSRFMKGSRLKGYSALRVVGNYGFNALFSLVAGKRITDLGSGLNLYAVEPLKTEYYKKFPDTLYFNDCMILALCQLKQRVLFFPISWPGGGPGQQQQAHQLRHQPAQNSAGGTWPASRNLSPANGAKSPLKIIQAALLRPIYKEALL